MEAIGRLAGGVAHDFNNLLAIITGYSELLLGRLGSKDPNREEVQEIKAAGDRAAALTRQLLAFSRKQVLEPRIIDLNSVVTGLMRMLPRLLGEDIKVTTNLNPGLGNVLIDTGQIEQVIVNLAVNARDAMPKGGTLIIETDNIELTDQYAHRHIEVTPGNYVMLAISDTGMGMDAKTVERIFEPFFTTKKEGTGLGLATVYGIIKQSGGNIWVYSEPEHGTTFKIYLHRVDRPAEPAESSAGKVASRSEVETILLVEDEEKLRLLVRKFLQSIGYTVLEATNGTDALRVAHEYHGAIDLLLTDVVMPETSGRDLANNLLAVRPEIKTLFMSGYTDDAIVHHGVLDPGTHLIVKPFNWETLTRKIREVLTK